jgi:ribosomal RNA-processing protein 17
VPNGEGDVASEDSDRWSGIPEPWEPPEIDREAEYIDEDKYTSVTIEEVGVTREGLQAANGHQTNGRDVEVDKLPSDNIAGGGDGKQKKHKWTKEKPRDKVNVVKKKRTKFRYESKAERKVTRVKDRARNSKQARARRAG